MRRRGEEQNVVGCIAEQFAQAVSISAGVKIDQ